ncbi:hypothetical protein ACWECC_33175 [Streptomyces microflavus]
MYVIAIVRKSQPAERHTCTSTEGLRDAVDELVRTEGGNISDRAGLAALIDNAAAMVDADGFAALTFKTAALTIRPAAPADIATT